MLGNEKKTSKIKNSHKKIFSFKLFLGAIAIFIFILFFLCYTTTKANSSQNKKRNLESKPESKPEPRPTLVPYITPNKVDTILDHLFYPYHSDIIRNMDDYEFIRDSLGKINMRLLFNSNIQGDYAKDIHTKVTYHHLIVVIETEKGNRFGGYTSNNFNPESLGLTATSIDVTKKDPTAFLFNLDKKTIYDIKQEKRNEALECDDYYVLNFGGNDLLIKDNFFNEGGSSQFPDYYGEGAPQNELTNGEKFFKVKNLEIFQALFYSEFGDEKNKMGDFKNFIK